MCLKTTGFVEVKQRAGCLSYTEDKFGYRSQLSRTLTHSNIVPWNPPQKVIESFSSDNIVRYFSDHFLTFEPSTRSSKSELKLLKVLSRASYDCVIMDKLVLLPIFLSLAKVCVKMCTQKTVS